MTLRDLSGNTKAAAIFAILGFVISFTTLSTSNINGVQTCQFMDYGAIVFGGLAIIFGGMAEMSALREESETRLLNLGIAGLAFLIGGYHIVTGLGIVGGPCAGV